MSRDAEVTMDLELRMLARHVPVPEDVIAGVKVWRLGRMVRLQRKGSVYIPAARARAMVPVNLDDRIYHHGCSCHKNDPTMLRLAVIDAIERGFASCKLRGAARIKQ
jgi:hypothetical protein